MSESSIILSEGANCCCSTPNLPVILIVLNVYIIPLEWLSFSWHHEDSFTAVDVMVGVNMHYIHRKNPGGKKSREKRMTNDLTTAKLRRSWHDFPVLEAKLLHPWQEKLHREKYLSLMIVLVDRLTLSGWRSELRFKRPVSQLVHTPHGPAHTYEAFEVMPFSSRWNLEILPAICSPNWIHILDAVGNLKLENCVVPPCE